MAHFEEILFSEQPNTHWYQHVQFAQLALEKYAIDSVHNTHGEMSLNESYYLN